MEMDPQTLVLLQETAQKAAAPQDLNLPGDHRTAHVAIAGEIKEIALPPANRDHTVATLEALASFAVAASNSGESRAVVFHDLTGCTLLLDDADRRDKITLPLAASDQWTLLREWDEKKPMLSQREVIAALRLVFNASPVLVNSFRRIDLKSNQTAQNQLERGRESLGRSVESQIINAADIPETITLSVSIYRNLGENQTYDVACAVEIDAQNGRVQIVPEPLRLDEIMHRHQADIADRLEGAFAEVDGGIPVYYGRP